MKISIIGAGNVATNLALAFKKAGHEIVQIYNRSNDAGKELAHSVAASFTAHAADIADADIYMVAVRDDVIAEVTAPLKLKEKIVAHTSGAKSKEELNGCSLHTGIFYPLQTMVKYSKLDFKNVPLLIEGSDKITAATLHKLASSISQNVHFVDEQQRQWIHVAAVFANNFTNHLYGISESLLAEHQLSFEILKPLIFHAVQNLNEYSPTQLQTGPAARGDANTIEKHLQLLGNNDRLKKIYEILTQSIISSSNQNHL